MDKIIQSMALPYKLPVEIFSIFDGYLYPDFLCLIYELPQELRGYLDLELSALKKRHEGMIVYHIPLKTSGYLKVRVKNNAIVEVSRLEQTAAESR